MEQRAVTRCANEIGKAILFYRALQGIYKADVYCAVDFIRLSEWAFFDQMFAHAIKVLDKNEKCGLVFLLGRLDPQGLIYSSRLTNIDKIRPKLRLIRNKTHFHLDRKGVQNSSKIWKQADITYALLIAAITDAFSIICDMHLTVYGTSFELPDYDGSDATRVAELAYNERILEGQWRDPKAPSIWDR